MTTRAEDLIPKTAARRVQQSRKMKRGRRYRGPAVSPEMEAKIAKQEDLRMRVMILLKEGCPCCLIAPTIASIADELKIERGRFWRWVKRQTQVIRERPVGAIERWVLRMELVKRAFARQAAEDAERERAEREARERADRQQS